MEIMNMRKVLTIVGVLALSVMPTVALAEPVFLVCKLTDKSGESAFDVQLNEADGTASYFTHRTQMTVKNRAIFTPNKVSFSAFEIDRRDLSFRRDNTGSAFYRLGGLSAADSGRCEVSESKRAF